MTAGIFDEPSNYQRAEWGREALQAFANRSYGLPADRDMQQQDAIFQALGDLLANLMHLVGPDEFATALYRAECHYVEEVAEEQVTP